jgi:hypothetical protein
MIDNPYPSHPIPSYFATNWKKSADEQGCELAVHSTNCICVISSPSGSQYLHFLNYILEEEKEYQAFFRSYGEIPVTLKMQGGELYFTFR